MTQPVFRFAPSPNGRLHLGHAYSALLNAELAGRSGGRFLLRIEDIDPTRCRPEFEQAIYEDLAWLGLAWEEPVRRQSEHFVEYAAASTSCRSRGLVYPVLLLAQGDRRGGVGARSGNGPRLAARSGRGAALSGHLPRSRGSRGRPSHRGRRRPCLAPRHRRGAARPRRRSSPIAVSTPDAAESVVAARPERWGDAVIVAQGGADELSPLRRGRRRRCRA